MKSNFISELSAAQHQKESSLSWFSVPLTLIKPEDSFSHRIIIGGTNIKIFEGQYLLKAFDIHQHPSGIDLIQKVLEPLPDNIPSLCVNAAYPIDPIINNGEIGGTIQHNVKGHHFDDILKKDLATVFREQGKTIESIQILNDIHYLLKRNCETKGSNAGLILGTGFNLGLVIDDNAINLEAADFNKFHPLKTTLAIDAESQKPGHHLLEKELGGKYLFKHYNITSTEDISSTAELAQLQDNISKNIWRHTRETVEMIELAVEEYMNTSVTWSYEGSVIEFLKAE